MRINHTLHPVIEQDIIETLEDDCSIAYRIVDVLVDCAQSQSAVDTEQQACLLLICEILAFVRDATEQNRGWAHQFADGFQCYMAEHVFVPETNQWVIQHLIDILQQSELTVHTALRDANAALMSQTDTDETPPLERLLDDIAHNAHIDVFELYEAIQHQTHNLIPIAMQEIMMDEILHSDHPLLQAICCLLLLHPEEQIRSYVGCTLKNQSNQPISGDSLRRLIAIRNWILPPERPVADKLIKQARKSNINCQPWPEAERLAVYATAFDGTGAQSLILLSKTQQHYHLAGVLLREQSGIKEPLLHSAKDQHLLDTLLLEITEETPCVPIDPQYFNLAIPHFIAITQQQNRPPPALLVGYAEMCQFPQWQPQYLDNDALLQRLHPTCDTFVLSPDNERRIQSSEHWTKTYGFMATWYEQDVDCDAVIASIIQQTPQASVEVHLLACRIRDQLLEQKREKWATRLLWTALWTKYAKKECGPSWQSVVCVARALQSAIPLCEIPLMLSIATETAHVFLRRSG